MAVPCGAREVVRSNLSVPEGRLPSGSNTLEGTWQNLWKGWQVIKLVFPLAVHLQAHIKCHLHSTQVLRHQMVDSSELWAQS